MSFLFGSRGKMPRNATFRITQEGEERLGRYAGSPEDRVLMALQTKGSSTVDEIASALGMSRGAVERAISNLMSGEYIQPIGGGMSA